VVLFKGDDKFEVDGIVLFKGNRTLLELLKKKIMDYLEMIIS
jgi:hypothetical protein